MATCIDIINDALFSIGGSSPINPAPNELINASFNRLLDWVDQLAIDGVDLGIPEGTPRPTEPGDELGNDPGLNLALKAGLAPWLAPLFQIKLPPGHEARGAADQAMQTLYARSMLPSLPEWPETLPVGVGNRRGPWSRVFFEVPEFVDTYNPNPGQTDSGGS